MGAPGGMPSTHTTGGERGGAWWGREGGWRRWEVGSMEQMSKSMKDKGS